MVVSKISTQRVTLGESVYRQLRDDIISLRLKPGEMVYESELAVSFGVSRTPIREAFQMLVADEFIEILPQRGARIAYFSKRKIEESWFIRESLEVSAFKKVARAWDDTDNRFITLRDEVMKCLDRQSSAALKEDYVEFFELDENFHRMILNQVENLTLMNFINHVYGHVNRMRYLEFHETKDTARILNEHKEVFKAIMSGDEALTEAQLIKHIRFSTDYSQKIMEKNLGIFSEDIESPNR